MSVEIVRRNLGFEFECPSDEISLSQTLLGRSYIGRLIHGSDVRVHSKICRMVKFRPQYKYPLKSEYADIMFPKDSECMIIATDWEIYLAEEDFAKATQDLPVRNAIRQATC